mgnify:CR=1 FL=1
MLRVCSLEELKQKLEEGRKAFLESGQLEVEIDNEMFLDCSEEDDYRSLLENMQEMAKKVFGDVEVEWKEERALKMIVKRR